MISFDVKPGIMDTKHHHMVAGIMIAGSECVSTLRSMLVHGE